MILYTNRQELYNDICESIRLFYPDEEITLCESAVNAEICVEVYCNYNAAVMFNGIRTEYFLDALATNKLEEKRYTKRCAKLAVYTAFSSLLDKKLPWGALTGIRPTKMFYEYGAGQFAKQLMQNTMCVSEPKMDLIKRIVKQQKEYISVPHDMVDIYIGIPFCKTRCVYCSFATHDATKHKLIPGYMQALLHEIDYTKRLIADLRLKVRCVYIGGGTPTALPDEYFIALMNACYGFTPELEFTVEAGRPDTINTAKLLSMKNCGVNRISINPQTMNESTLRLIGRQHTADDIEKTFALARSIGFDVINADMIAGLPGEDTDMFKYSLERILSLEPENVTVHTLSLKRGSYLTENPDKFPMPCEETVNCMVDTACSVLSAVGYEPYYLYRQKYQAGNLENVGYCKTSTQCVYNIDIMEETASIIALGAGAISKRVYIEQGRIERAANSKSITDYIERVALMEDRKKQLFNN